MLLIAIGFPRNPFPIHVSSLPSNEALKRPLENRTPAQVPRILLDSFRAPVQRFEIDFLVIAPTRPLSLVEPICTGRLRRGDKLGGFGRTGEVETRLGVEGEPGCWLRGEFRGEETPSRYPLSRGESRS